jgi:hypothetical protein
LTKSRYVVGKYKDYQWARKTRIYITDGLRLKGSDHAQQLFLDCYERDLGFSRPRGFDFSMYGYRGIHYERTQKQWDIYRRVRLLSLQTEPKVFVLLGKVAQRYFPCVEKNMGHMVYVGDGFHMWSARDHTFMSQACDHLKVSKEIWRM